jgi:nucleotide-binding universal stress UspA family protein
MTDAPLTSILVATDLSAESVQAVRAATRLGARTGAHVHVLHAVTPSVPSFWEGCEENGRDARAAEEARAALSDLLAEHRQGGATIASETVVIERAFHAITMRAREVGADLLLLGPPASRRVGREVASGTVDRVIRIVDMPCMVVQGELPDRVQRLRVPYDFSAPAREALATAVEWARRGVFAPADQRPTVEVCHVLPPASPAPPPWSVSEDEVEARLRDEVARAAGVELPGIELVLPRSVSPAKAIVEANGYDVIVMASHGHNLFERWLVGSVASSVTRSAATPVVLIPPARWR